MGLGALRASQEVEGYKSPGKLCMFKLTRPNHMYVYYLMAYPGTWICVALFYIIELPGIIENSTQGGSRHSGGVEENPLKGCPSVYSTSPRNENRHFAVFISR